ncbi:hypothetical protein E9228_003295 [Curtobacterium flaccumfaciens]|uniref:Uncharacterized protein n=1 Tax=Curtobacterium salicis TaxID=1779862 RepID=A0ABX0TDW1_9MICO|nr:hypothetical protein [Curtobacterium sp. WW7]NII42621.1 hypothetical protein [Curtobacterium sp. WW7]
MLTETRSYAERLFDSRQIGKFSRDDAAQALREPAERLGAQYAPDALATLLDAARASSPAVSAPTEQH